MTNESRILLGEFHAILQGNARRVMDELKSNPSGLNTTLQLAEQDVRVLGRAIKTQEEREVLAKVLVAYGRLGVFSMLGIIDGVVETGEALPDLSIVNRETGEEINEGFLHDEFTELTPD
jgi:hypothetical protein